ncbi:MAG: hypothetical protein MJ248_05980 [Bacilli bacterium]|nr:hypothetical protein [Bacilli bacterium]
MKYGKLLVLIPTIFLLGSCGSKSVDTSDTNPTNTNSEEKDDFVVGENDVVVTVLKSDNTPAVGAYVRWCEGERCFMPVEVNSAGKAKLSAKTGVEYNVHLTLPEEGYGAYAYNPNIYTQSLTHNKNLTIRLSDVSTPTSGDGNKYTSYAVKEGTYKADVDGTNYTYYGFTPSRPGLYKVETWVETLDFEDPIIAGCGNNPGYIREIEKFDNISDTNQNALYEFEVYSDAFGQDSNGNSVCNATYFFGMGAKTACSYFFNISYVSPIDEEDEDDITNVLPTYNITPYANSDKTLVGFDLTENDAAVFNSSDGTYHYLTATGPQIVAHIKTGGTYIIGSIYDMASNQNVLTNNGTKKYNDFITAYAEASNSDGVYPLTEELKTLFEELAEVPNGLWSFIESGLGSELTIGSQAKFLYGCSYYSDTVE